jgi:hypothetical protein
VPKLAVLRLAKCPTDTAASEEKFQASRLGIVRMATGQKPLAAASSLSESATLRHHTLEGVMDTEKKPNEPAVDEPKKDIGELVGDLVVSGATVLAHSAAEAVVKRVRKAAAKTAPVKAVAKIVKKAKKSGAAPKAAKSKKKTSKKSGAKRVGKKAGKKSAKATKSKKSKSSKKSKR